MKKEKTILKFFLVTLLFGIFNILIRGSFDLKHQETLQTMSNITIEKEYIDEALTRILEEYPDMSNTIKSSFVEVPKNDNMIPQGITKIDNSYTIITAYNYKMEEYSKCYVLDKSGNLINTVTLDTDSHVGGIAYDKKNGLIWIPDNKGVLNAYDLKQIINENEVTAKYKFYDISLGLTNYLNVKKDNIDYLCIDGEYLYIGNFSTKSNGIVKKYKIVTKKRSIDLELVNEFKVPSEIQGITFYNYNNAKYMILSKSFGRRRNSYILVYQYDESVTDYSKLEYSKITLTFPPMLEQVTAFNDNLYILFESNAQKYSDCTAKVEHICTLDLRKIFKALEEE